MDLFLSKQDKKNDTIKTIMNMIKTSIVTAIILWCHGVFTKEGGKEDFYQLKNIVLEIIIEMNQ